MSYFLYLFFPIAINLQTAPSPYIKTMILKPTQFEGDLSCWKFEAESQNDLDGTSILSAFRNKPKNFEDLQKEFIKKAESRNLDKNFVNKQLKTLQTISKEELNDYQKEPQYWIDFIRHLLVDKNIEKIGFLAKIEGNEVLHSPFFKKHLIIKLSQLNVQFFREIEDDVFYEFVK